MKKLLIGLTVGLLCFAFILPLVSLADNNQNQQNQQNKQKTLTFTGIIKTVDPTALTITVQPTGFSFHRFFSRIFSFGVNKLKNQTYLISVPSVTIILKKATDGTKITGVFGDLAVNQRIQIKGARSTVSKTSFTASQVFILNLVKVTEPHDTRTTVTTLACTADSDCFQCGQRCIRKVAGQIFNCPNNDASTDTKCLCTSGECKAIAIVPADEYCTKKDTTIKMNYQEALNIASASTSVCIKGGELMTQHTCNEGGYWWIGFKPTTVKKGCNPACVVDIVNKTAEINWRCTGLNPIRINSINK
jgi:hypothetical protein